MHIDWIQRTSPLDPTAVVARGSAASRLCRLLMQLDDDDLRRLRGVSSPSLIALIGPHRYLPWVEGVRYLGLDDDAPGLYLPTECRPSCPVTWFHRRLTTALQPGPPRPWAVLPEGPLVFSLADALPIHRGKLAAAVEPA